MRGGDANKPNGCGAMPSSRAKFGAFTWKIGNVMAGREFTANYVRMAFTLLENGSRV